MFSWNFLLDLVDVKYLAYEWTLVEASGQVCEWTMIVYCIDGQHEGFHLAVHDWTIVWASVHVHEWATV